MEKRTQKEIVEQYLLDNELEKETSENIYLPGINMFFGSVNVKNKTIDKVERIPTIHVLKSKKNRTEIAKLIVDLISQKFNSIGIEWDFNNNYAYVQTTSSATLDFDNEEWKTDLVEILVVLLKTRPNITGIKWKFGEDFITVLFS